MMKKRCKPMMQIVAETKKIISEDSAFDQKRDIILKKYGKSLFNALKWRQYNQEDLNAYEDVESIVEVIMQEMGYPEAKGEPWMDDEMFSGDYSATKAYEYFIEMLNDMYIDGIIK